MKNTFHLPKYKKLGISGFLGFLTLLITLNLLLTSCVDELEAPQIDLKVISLPRCGTGLKKIS